jgi:hypothetical protein
MAANMSREPTAWLLLLLPPRAVGDCRPSDSEARLLPFAAAAAVQGARGIARFACPAPAISGTSHF